ncbi:competence protein ComEC [Butyrivibrio sp. Su6]|uniref:DNA internalization-related competence protein ComEC/Rec2 n=1 Tax=Butyrivibrio sp. Su6 TaxID=1520810 RepID=UPI00089ECE8E|nr:DNA internalization-related competence protein ComEC/Rec2 [Butyrivibrio sp. Su6]SEF97358.1 competence protein ComEC [Butyrivibrio sp. Su6]
MKRPLCAVALLMAAIVYIYLEFSISRLTVYEPEESFTETTKVVGVVIQKEQKKNSLGDIYTALYLVPRKPLKGKFEYIECYLSADSYEPSIGETVLVSGKVNEFATPRNPGEFDSRLYYSTLKIAYRIKNAYIDKANGKKDYFKESLYKLRLVFERNLDKTLGEEDAAIMKAMLLGDKSFMDEEIKDLYKDSGIMHILAVSGLHISIIGMGIYRLLRKIKAPGGFSVAIALTIMFCYGAMCGMNTSAFRAILMFSLRLLAPLLGRTYDIFTSLSLAFMLLILEQPLYLYSSGFLFSFGAIIGIALVKPLLKPEVLRYAPFTMKFADDSEESLSKKVLNKCLDCVSTCLAIMLVTLPVYTSFYYTYPIGSIVLNLVVLPLMGVLMVIGIICMSVGALIIFVGKAFGFGAHIILLFYKVSCNISKVNGGLTWYVGHSSKIQVVIYVFLITAFIAFLYFERDNLAGKKYTRRELIKFDAFKFLFILFSVTVLTFRIHPDLEINMIDVGQGDGILISSGGKNILIDGGSTSKKNVGKYQIIPFLKYKGVGKVDVAIVTHEDEDHISGLLEIMDDMEKGGICIKRLILPEASVKSRGENYDHIEKRAKALGIPISYINTGESFNMSDISFLCLNPQKNMVTEGANAYSTVLYMKYGDFTALFTGDMEKEGLDNVKNMLKLSRKEVALLKVAHHGSMYTTDEEFLKLTKPELALISCGENNKYGHPHKETLERLKSIGAAIYRTDEKGCISVEVNNDHIKLRGFLE